MLCHIPNDNEQLNYKNTRYIKACVRKLGVPSGRHTFKLSTINNDNNNRTCISIASKRQWKIKEDVKLTTLNGALSSSHVPSNSSNNDSDHNSNNENDNNNDNEEEETHLDMSEILSIHGSMCK